MNVGSPNNKKFLGVVPPAAFETLWYPKQLLLMFDRLVIDLGASGLSPRERGIIQRAMPEINGLIKSEMLTLLSGLLATKSLYPSAEELARARDTLRKREVTFERQSAHALRQKGYDAVAMTESPDVGGADEVVGRDVVVRIVLNEFPAPSDATPWEAVGDFRSDRLARDKFLALKQWINKAGASGLKQYEVVDELQSLMNDYAHHMALHKMKTQTRALEVVVTTTAEIAENLVKIRLGKAASSIFQARKASIKLLEDERDMPGKEVAYIAAALKEFGSR